MLRIIDNQLGQLGAAAEGYAQGHGGELPADEAVYLVVDEEGRVLQPMESVQYVPQAPPVEEQVHKRAVDS